MSEAHELPNYEHIRLNFRNLIKCNKLLTKGLKSGTLIKRLVLNKTSINYTFFVIQKKQELNRLLNDNKILRIFHKY